MTTYIRFMVLMAMSVTFVQAAEVGLSYSQDPIDAYATYYVKQHAPKFDPSMKTYRKNLRLQRSFEAKKNLAYAKAFDKGIRARAMYPEYDLMRLREKEIGNLLKNDRTLRGNKDAINELLSERKALREGIYKLRKQIAPELAAYANIPAALRKQWMEAVPEEVQYRIEGYDTTFNPADLYTRERVKRKVQKYEPTWEKFWAPGRSFLSRYYPASWQSTINTAQ